MAYLGQKSTTRGVAVALIALGLTAGAVEEAQAASPSRDRAKETILEILLRTDGAQALAAAVETGEAQGCSGLTSTLNDKKSRLVAFVPSNTAFEGFFRLAPNALAGLAIDQIKEQLPDLLASIELTDLDLCDLLLNHVAEVEDKPKDSSADDLLAKGSIVVANGSEFPISVGTGGVFVNYEVTIVEQILAKNGVILVVDDVIQDPPPPSADVITIFTAGTFDGDFDGNPGLAGADAACQEFADNSGLGGTSWTAWLSDSITDAIDRIPDGGEYRRIDGTLVADDKADLADGLLQVALNQTQYGTEFGTQVWTGTGPDGRSTGTHCDDWTNDGVSASSGCSGPGDPTCGTLGLSVERGPKWTRQPDYPVKCSTGAALYCFGILD